MRKEFLSNVSHELKTPIALIQGYAEGLQDNINDDVESREFYCEVIIDEANKMNKMVKKLLTLNQIEFGNNQVSFEHFDIVQVLKSVINSALLLAGQKEAVITMEDYEPLYVWADEYMIEEVVTNYISNAINHVDGEKKINVSMVKHDDVVRVSVFNTGKCIPEDELDKIWIKFYKVDKARTREYGGSGGVYRDSVQAWLPIKNIIGGVVITKDNRFVKIMEVLPVNIYLKSAIDRQNIISSFASYLQIAPDELQMIARTLPADTQAYVEQMQRYAEQEENEACREMIEDNIREIGHGIAGGAMRHRFFLVFQYEPSMRAKRNTVQAIIQRLNEEADTARRYLDLCELEVLEPQYSDNFVLKLLYEILNKKTSQRVRLPEGVFDMTTAVHGIYEE